jgi:hypothetical protein
MMNPRRIQKAYFSGLFTSAVVFTVLMAAYPEELTFVNHIALIAVIPQIIWFFYGICWKHKPIEVKGKLICKICREVISE